MKRKFLWNKQGLRLEWIKAGPGKPLNWLFCPGGPGLGSESLSDLTQGLDLPGTIWHLDYPGDGSNTFDNNVEAFRAWPAALQEVVETLGNVILVAHSTGGMFILSLPVLEKRLSGLILMDSAPDASWQGCLAEMMEERPIPELKELDLLYRSQPSNALLKQLTVASAPYLFTQKGLEMGRVLLERLPYNYEICNWSEEHFDRTYAAQWIPQSLPTLIFGGSEDHLTPLHLFKERADFQRKNILLKEIPNAGHFPWIENPSAVTAAFTDYIELNSLNN